MKTSNKSYKNEEDLRELYEKYNSQTDIADEFGCDQATISHWMEKFEIETTDGHSNIRSRDFTKTLNTECEFCGNEFYKRPVNKTKNENHFCSTVCYGNWQSENYSGENPPPHIENQKNRIDVNCQNCGAEKEVIPSHHKKVENHYCSPECQSEDQDRTGENNPSWSGGKEIVACGYCNDELKIYPHRLDLSKSHFCNRDCKDRWLSETQVGKDHHQWKGGGLYYGERWPRMRSKVQDRDGNECQLCGDEEEEIGQKPDVHHIEPVRSFDDYEEAHTMDNMVQVCRGCHRTLETHGADEQRKMVF